MSLTRTIVINVKLSEFDEGKVKINLPNILSKEAMSDLICEELVEDGWSENEDGELTLDNISNIPKDYTLKIIYDKETSTIKAEGEVNKVVTITQAERIGDNSDDYDREKAIIDSGKKAMADIIEKNINDIYKIFKEKYMPKAAGKALVEKARSLGGGEPKLREGETVDNDLIYSITVEIDV